MRNLNFQNLKELKRMFGDPDMGNPGTSFRDTR